MMSIIGSGEMFYIYIKMKVIYFAATMKNILDYFEFYFSSYKATSLKEDVKMVSS